MKAIELKNEKSPKLVTPQIPELKSKWPKCRGSPNLSFEYSHAWQLKSCRFESSLSHQFCTKKCLLLFIQFNMSCDVPENTLSAMFYYKKWGTKRYHTEPSQLFSLDCISFGSSKCGRRLSFLYLISYVFSTKSPSETCQLTLPGD